VINVNEQTITIVGTHIDKLTGNEIATIRDKKDTLKMIEQRLRDDFGYSLVIASK